MAHNDWLIGYMDHNEYDLLVSACIGGLEQCFWGLDQREAPTWRGSHLWWNTGLRRMIVKFLSLKLTLSSLLNTVNVKILELLVP